FWLARQAFAKANLRLVVSMARRVGRGRMPMPDLVQEGNIGLMQAIDRFDHTKGFRFSTYGAWWIRHAMNRALQNKSREIRLPVHIQDALHKVNRVRREYEALHGESIPTELLADLCDLTPAKIAKLDRHYLVSEFPTSLDVESGDNAERDRIEMAIEDRPALPHEALEQRATTEVVIEALEALPETEQMILRMRFGLDTDQSMTLREIGEHYSLSRERIRQLQERALGRIRSALESRELL
ncbi:MAG: sigma-70 family RNA polymerase sigma factor, partial [Nannocystaceae bacterium]